MIRFAALQGVLRLYPLRQWEAVHGALASTTPRSASHAANKGQREKKEKKEKKEKERPALVAVGVFGLGEGEGEGEGERERGGGSTEKGSDSALLAAVRAQLDDLQSC
jgi:hypothetical protein